MGVVTGTRENNTTGSNIDNQETSADRLVYFAAERTLFAWIRAGLALMALGFVVDRFALVLTMMQTTIPKGRHTELISSWIGVLFVIVGIGVNITGGIRYQRFERHYHRSLDTRPGHGLSMGNGFVIVISIIGVVLVFFLCDMFR